MAKVQCLCSFYTVSTVTNNSFRLLTQAGVRFTESRQYRQKATSGRSEDCNMNEENVRYSGTSSGKWGQGGGPGGCVRATGLLHKLRYHTY